MTLVISLELKKKYLWAGEGQRASIMAARGSMTKKVWEALHYIIGNFTDFLGRVSYTKKYICLTEGLSLLTIQREEAIKNAAVVRVRVCFN